MNDLVYVAIALLEAVVLWELVARTADTPMLPLGPAELAVRLGLVESIAARLAAPPASDRGPVLPPPPVASLAPPKAVDDLVEWHSPRPTTPLEQQLAGANWALGFMSGRSVYGGVICRDRNI